MAVSLKEIALALPFQLSTAGMMMAVMYSKDFPENSDIIAIPGVGMILGAALIATVWIKSVRRERNDERRLSRDAESFLAGGAV